MMRKKIAVFYKGGTFGMIPKDRHDPPSALIPRKWGRFSADLKRSLKSILFENPYHVDFFELGEPVDSSHMASREWLEAAKAVKQKYPDYDGFVLIQGTHQRGQIRLKWQDYPD